MTRQAYPTDLSDAEWAYLEPLFVTHRRGRKQTISRREICNAIFYVTKTGCQWRMLPHDFPKWHTVHDLFLHWQRSGLWATLNDTLRVKVRVAAGKEPEPSAAVLDSQSVKTAAEANARGFDAAKLITGRKRHILVDTLGLLLAVLVTVASVQDRDGGKKLLAQVKDRLPRLQLIWADGAYAGQLVDWVKAICQWVLQIVKRSDAIKGFQVLPHRWIVERTFAWLGRARRLSKDYERLSETSEAFVYVAMTRLMLKRLTRPVQA
jgi:putative transposase